MPAGHAVIRDRSPEQPIAAWTPKELACLPRQARWEFVTAELLLEIGFRRRDPGGAAGTAPLTNCALSEMSLDCMAPARRTGDIEGKARVGIQSLSVGGWLMNRLFPLAMLGLVIGFGALHAATPTDVSAFEGRWVNAIIASGEEGVVAISNLTIWRRHTEMSGFASEYRIKLTTCETVPVSCEAAIIFFGFGGDSSVATHAQWFHSRDRRVMFGTIAAEGGALITDTLFIDLSLQDGGTRTREVFVRAPEAEEITVEVLGADLDSQDSRIASACFAMTLIAESQRPRWSLTPIRLY